MIIYSTNNKAMTAQAMAQYRRTERGVNVIECRNAEPSDERETVESEKYFHYYHSKIF